MKPGLCLFVKQEADQVIQFGLKFQQFLGRKLADQFAARSVGQLNHDAFRLFVHMKAEYETAPH